jgi:hypothetical protein
MGCHLDELVWTLSPSIRRGSGPPQIAHEKGQLQTITIREQHNLGKNVDAKEAIKKHTTRSTCR